MKLFLFYSFHDCPIGMKDNKLIHSSDEQYIWQVWEQQLKNYWKMEVNDKLIVTE
jgi:hypothetical protein